MEIKKGEGISYAVVRKLFSEVGTSFHTKTEVEAGYKEIINSSVEAKNALQEIIQKIEDGSVLEGRKKTEWRRNGSHGVSKTVYVTDKIML